MLVTITTTREPATDLGYLLHKHPDRVYSVSVSDGTAHVFFPEATQASCTAALLLEVDPIALARGRREALELGQYVNDRPYAASSMLAVALKAAFRTALTGRCDARPELAATTIPLRLHVPALRCRDGADLVTRLFAPLGWTVDAKPAPFDPPGWGNSPYLTVALHGEHRLADALNHLYVLLPVLDDAKHYWVCTDEVDKLIKAGGDWLAAHPDKHLISNRYLAHQRQLTESALVRLAEADDADPADLDNAVAADDAVRDKPLAARRREAVIAALKQAGARTVADLGCGAGLLTRDLLADSRFERVTATDVSARALGLAARRLRLDRMPAPQRRRLAIFQSSLTYRDDRLAGLDAAVLMEVIEHVDPQRLGAVERTVFGFASPGTVVVTTPNAEYNTAYPALPAGTMRHLDHRFEWTRPQLREWAARVAADYGYQVTVGEVGEVSENLGAPTQLCVFVKAAP